MIHLTLNTGHARRSPRSEVSAAVVAACRPLLAPGTHPLPVPGGYTLVVPPLPGPGAWCGTVFAPGGRPLVTIGVAADAAGADGLWPHLEAAYLSLTELPGLRAADFAAPKRPPETPWCAGVVILPTPAEAGWLGDLERCLAWAFLTRDAN